MDTDDKKRGKKIIHVVQHLAPGGLETLTLDLLRLAKPQDVVMIISLEGTREEAIHHWPKLEAHAEQLVFLQKEPGVQFKVVSTLIKAFTGIKPDVVHTHHIGPLIYAGFAARVSGVPTRIHTEHDAWHLRNTKRRRLQSVALKAAQPMLVADATRVYNQLKSMFAYDKLITIKNGIDCDKFHPLPKQLTRSLFNLPKDRIIIGCAGRLESVKGQDQLIKAMAFLPQHVNLVLAGDGSERANLEALVLKLGLKERVFFLGLVDDMTAFYQSLDLFCLPSRHEGLPLSPLEAQACNVPTVAMNVGAVNETLCPNTGILVKNHNIIHLAHALLSATIRTENERKVSVSACPRDFILTNFNIKNMVQSYNELAKGAYA
ncbi:glycosyltransferase [Vibrio sp. T187]|uniref:glycosyltransferase n=1 Tax=Vibrio TaxID=662 RepID=UPI0010C9C72D|nr:MULTISPECIES: glycosyltransferase [Vibrio]MBW3697799.1 glycosyltransferase [Vibrio sp. T187]